MTGRANLRTCVPLPRLYGGVLLHQFLALFLHFGERAEAVFVLPAERIQLV